VFNLPDRPKTDLEEAMSNLYASLSQHEEDTETYAKMVEQLVKLHALQMAERRPRVSVDTLAAIAANLGGILIIVGYEQKHILTSKALGFIRKIG
jgi:ferritin-like metal-binding protein YciE